MSHNTGNFIFERPDWMTDQGETDDGHPITATAGVTELADDREYWKVLQRFETGNEFRVRASVWSYNPSTGNRHRDQTSDLNVPVHIWNQLIHNARRKGIFDA